jgi:hypothetical protein
MFLKKIIDVIKFVWLFVKIEIQFRQRRRQLKKKKDPYVYK